MAIELKNKITTDFSLLQCTSAGKSEGLVMAISKITGQKSYDIIGELKKLYLTSIRGRSFLNDLLDGEICLTTTVATILVKNGFTVNSKRGVKYKGSIIKLSIQGRDIFEDGEKMYGLVMHGSDKYALLASDEVNIQAPKSHVKQFNKLPDKKLMLVSYIDIYTAKEEDAF